jgi:hypothetical protein
MEFGFHCVARIKEGLLNIYTGAYFAYKHQMWQKYFLRIIVTFGYKINFLESTLLWISIFFPANFVMMLKWFM